MPKFTLTIECDTLVDLEILTRRLTTPMPKRLEPRSPEFQADESVTVSFPHLEPEPIATEPEPIATQAPEPETPEETPPAKPPASKKGRPKKPTVAEQLAASVEATKPQQLNGDLPALDKLKEVIVAAVRDERKPGSTKKVIEPLLPAFREKTGLNFVMDAKDEHRQALFDLIHEAGLSVA